MAKNEGKNRSNKAKKKIFLPKARLDRDDNNY